jgi:hypothetical protein
MVRVLTETLWRWKMSKPLDDAVVEATKHYAHSPIGLVAVLSDEVGGFVYVAKWIKASKLGQPFQLVEDEEDRWAPAKPFPEAPDRTLTDEVIADLWHANGGFHHHFARAVERYLKGEE